MIKIVYEEQAERTAAYDGEKPAGQCNYALKAFENNSEYMDVWAK